MLTNKDRKNRLIVFKILFFILNCGLTTYPIFYWGDKPPAAPAGSLQESLQIVFVLLFFILWFAFLLFFARHPCPSCNSWCGGERIGLMYLGRDRYRDEYKCISSGHKWSGEEMNMSNVGWG